MLIALSSRVVSPAPFRRSGSLAGARRFVHLIEQVMCHGPGHGGGGADLRQTRELSRADAAGRRSRKCACVGVCYRM